MVVFFLEKSDLLEPALLLVFEAEDGAEAGLALLATESGELLVLVTAVPLPTGLVGASRDEDGVVVVGLPPELRD